MPKTQKYGMNIRSQFRYRGRGRARRTGGVCRDVLCPHATPHTETKVYGAVTEVHEGDIVLWGDFLFKGSTSWSMVALAAQDEVGGKPVFVDCVPPSKEFCKLLGEPTPVPQKSVEEGDDGEEEKEDIDPKLVLVDGQVAPFPAEVNLKEAHQPEEPRAVDMDLDALDGEVDMRRRDRERTMAASDVAALFNEDSKRCAHCGFYTFDFYPREGWKPKMKEPTMMYGASVRVAIGENDGGYRRGVHDPNATPYLVGVATVQRLGDQLRCLGVEGTWNVMVSKGLDMISIPWDRVVLCVTRSDRYAIYFGRGRRGVCVNTFKGGASPLPLRLRYFAFNGGTPYDMIKFYGTAVMVARFLSGSNVRLMCPEHRHPHGSRSRSRSRSRSPRRRSRSRSPVKVQYCSSDVDATMADPPQSMEVAMFVDVCFPNVQVYPPHLHALLLRSSSLMHPMCLANATTLRHVRLSDCSLFCSAGIIHRRFQPRHASKAFDDPILTDEEDAFAFVRSLSELHTLEVLNCEGMTPSMHSLNGHPSLAVVHVRTTEAMYMHLPTERLPALQKFLCCAMTKEEEVDAMEKMHPQAEVICGRQRWLRNEMEKDPVVEITFTPADMALAEKVVEYEGKKFKEVYSGLCCCEQDKKKEVYRTSSLAEVQEVVSRLMQIRPFAQYEPLPQYRRYRPVAEDNASSVVITLCQKSGAVMRLFFNGIGCVRKKEEDVERNRHGILHQSEEDVMLRTWDEDERPGMIICTQFFGSLGLGVERDATEYLVQYMRDHGVEAPFKEREEAGQGTDKSKARLAVDALLRAHRGNGRRAHRFLGRRGRGRAGPPVVQQADQLPLAERMANAARAHDIAPNVDVYARVAMAVLGEEDVGFESWRMQPMWLEDVVQMLGNRSIQVLQEVIMEENPLPEVAAYVKKWDRDGSAVKLGAARLYWSFYGEGRPRGAPVQQGLPIPFHIARCQIMMNNKDVSVQQLGFRVLSSLTDPVPDKLVEQIKGFILRNELKDYACGDAIRALAVLRPKESVPVMMHILQRHASILSSKGAEKLMLWDGKSRPLGNSLFGSVASALCLANLDVRDKKEECLSLLRDMGLTPLDVQCVSGNQGAGSFRTSKSILLSHRQAFCAAAAALGDLSLLNAAMFSRDRRRMGGGWFTRCLVRHTAVHAVVQGLCKSGVGWALHALPIRRPRPFNGRPDELYTEDSEGELNGSRGVAAEDELAERVLHTLEQLHAPGIELVGRWAKRVALAPFLGRNDETEQMQDHGREEEKKEEEEQGGPAGPVEGMPDSLMRARFPDHVPLQRSEDQELGLDQGPKVYRWPDPERQYCVAWALQRWYAIYGREFARPRCGCNMPPSFPHSLVCLAARAAAAHQVSTDGVQPYLATVIRLHGRFATAERFPKMPCHQSVELARY